MLHRTEHRWKTREEVRENRATPQKLYWKVCLFPFFFPSFYLIPSVLLSVSVIVFKHYPLILCNIFYFFSVQHGNACEENEKGILLFCNSRLRDLDMYIFAYAYMFFLGHITWCICTAKYAGGNRENIAFRLCSIDLDIIHSLPFVGFSCALV